MTTALHVLAALARWSVASPWHALGAVAAGVILAARLRSRPAPEKAVVRSGGLVALVAVVGGLVTGWYLLTHPQKAPAPAATPKPATRTVIVHQTVTKVIHAAGHSGLPAWAIVALVVVALGTVCGLTLGRSSGS